METGDIVYLRHIVFPPAAIFFYNIKVSALVGVSLLIIRCGAMRSTQCKR